MDLVEKIEGFCRKRKRARVERGKTILGVGISLSSPGEEILLKIDDSLRSGHVGIFGTTRIGKTRLMENIVEQDIRKGYSVVVVDPKGDSQLLAKVIQTCAEEGRLKDFMLLDLARPSCSVKLNPLYRYYIPEELVHHVTSSLKVSGKDSRFFVAVAIEVTQSIIESLIALAREGSRDGEINLYDLKVRCGHRDLERLRATIEMVPGTEDTVIKLNQILDSPTDFFAKISSSLRTTLSALTSGIVGEVMGKARGNPFIERLERGEGVVLYFNTHAQLNRETAESAGKLLISNIQSLVGKFFASGRKLTPPLCIHIDEGYSVLYPGIEDLFSKSGGADVWIHFYTQSAAQIEEVIGRDGAKSIIDNMNTWVVMRLNHPETARHIEETAPIVRRYQAYLGFDDDLSMREVEQPVVTADDVLNRLGPREFYLRTYTGWFKGMTLDVSPTYIRLNLPDLILQNDSEN